RSRSLLASTPTRPCTAGCAPQSSRVSSGPRSTRVPRRAPRVLARRRVGSEPDHRGARQLLVQMGAGFVETDDLDLYVTPAEVLAHLVQGGHRGGIPYVRARHVDHDLGQSLFGVVEPIDQLIGGGEEHLTGD